MSHSPPKPTTSSQLTIPLLPPMAAISIFLLSLLTLAGHVPSGDYTATSLYLSPKTTFSNYDKMLQSFKIFIYAPPPTTAPNLYTTKQESQFYTSLIHSPFITQDPTQAHLFFIPFPSSTSVRSLARLIRTIRLTFPFWNRTLGADHVYLSAAGVDSSSDRNIVELKKNSIQISCFPTSSGLFIPHKDVTLPPLHSFTITATETETSSFNASTATEFLGYMKVNNRTDRATVRSIGELIEEINNHPEFKVEFEHDPTEKHEKVRTRTRTRTTDRTLEEINNQPEFKVEFEHDPTEKHEKLNENVRTRATDRTIEEINNQPEFKVEFEHDPTEKHEKVNEKVKEKFTKSSRFCLFVYGSDMTWMVEAMALRCVPVVITDRPIQDLPLMDVINWPEMAVFVGSGGGVKGLKRVLDGIEKGRYEKMVESGVAAVQHLGWNAEPQTHDAFHMVLYQLWVRRHTIRYARWVEQ